MSLPSAFSRRSSLVVLLTAAASIHAFQTPNMVRPHQQRPAFVTLSSSSLSTMERGGFLQDLPFYADFKESAESLLEQHAATTAPQQAAVLQVQQRPTMALTKAKKTGGAVHKKGLLSPVVLATKAVLGETKLNQMRGQAIALHGDVIKRFVETSDTALGHSVLRQLFCLADANDSGNIDIDELQVALRTLGFDWLKPEQVRGIFDRADTDANGAIDIDEWMREAPKTLKTNLVKLAKKNGGDLGLLV